MGSAVKWVFYALFGNTSIVKRFHSFEYRKIPGCNALWRCSLYSTTIFKRRIQLLTVSILALPNKSPPFRLSHFASEKLLNVHVLHFLDKQWLPEFVLLITVLNNQWTVSSRIRTNDLPGKEPTSIHSTVLTFGFPNICTIYHWSSGHFPTSENERYRRNMTKLVFPSLCPLKSSGEDFKNVFETFQFSWILLATHAYSSSKLGLVER